MNIIKKFVLALLVYFDHGWRRVNLPINWFYRIVIIFGVAGYFSGLNLNSFNFWILFIPLALIVLAALVGFTIYFGYLDRHKKGTFIPEEKMKYALDGVHLWNHYYTFKIHRLLLEQLGGKTPKELILFEKFLKERLEFLGVFDFKDPSFKDWE